jgi:hypothetical protein
MQARTEYQRCQIFQKLRPHRRIPSSFTPSGEKFRQGMTGEVIFEPVMAERRRMSSGGRSMESAVATCARRFSISTAQAG